MPKLGSLLKKRAGDGLGVRLFFAADVHGNDVCWRKFVNAGKFYDVQAVIMGGDLCGKALVPVIKNGVGYKAHLSGEDRHVSSPEELNALERAIRMNGFYPWRVTAEGLEQLRDDAAFRARTFERVMVEDVCEWVKFADSRLAGTSVRAFVIPGNDDPWSIDQALENATFVVPCDEKITSVGSHELLSFSWANRTPWNSHRELDEDELYIRLRALADQLESPRTAIFNVHVPPHDSGLDLAPELDETLKPVLTSGQPRMIPVGSTAVRQVIEEVQPLITLHGHIHESQGIVRIGDTVVVNPGSEYNSGRLLGCIVELRGDQVYTTQLVAG